MYSQYRLIPQLIPQSSLARDLLEAENEHVRGIDIPCTFGREELITSLLSSCTDRSCPYNENIKNKNCYGTNLPNHKRPCQYCCKILKLQRFLSKAMLKIIVDSDGNGNTSKKVIFRVYVAGPNAPFFYLNKRQIISGKSISSIQLCCQCGCRHECQAKLSLKENPNAKSLSQIKIQTLHGNTQLSLSDERISIHKFEDTTGKSWKGGLSIKINDILSFINIAQTDVSFHFILKKIDSKTMYEAEQAIATQPTPTQQSHKEGVDSNGSHFDSKQLKISILHSNQTSSIDQFSSSPILTMHHFSEPDKWTKPKNPSSFNSDSFSLSLTQNTVQRNMKKNSCFKPNSVNNDTYKKTFRSLSRFRLERCKNRIKSLSKYHHALLSISLKYHRYEEQIDCNSENHIDKDQFIKNSSVRDTGFQIPDLLLETIALMD